MSVSQAIDEIEYPESDGDPMGETDLHREWMVRIQDILKHRYRDQHVYVASNLLLYYEQGNNRRFVVPDNFVVLDCAPGRRRTFKTWEENRVPNVVFEVTSRSTRQEDTIRKPTLYERLRVAEYFLYDPDPKSSTPALQGYRLINGQYTLIPEIDGRLTCEELALQLSLDGNELQLTDQTTGQLLLTQAESEQRARLAAEARIQELEDELKRLRGERP